jgi:predicted nucleotidyltransferase
MLSDSVQMIRLVAERLAELNERMVFLGGATLGLLITEPGAPPPRPTKDVDLAVEITMLEYLNDTFRTELLARCFREAPEDGVICRWTIENAKVDIVPTTSTILGFSNRWYPTAFAHAQPHQFPDGPSIRLISAACFVATKLEAFAGRGRGDYVGSHDIEDVIAVVDGRPTIEADINTAPTEIRSFLAHEFARLLTIPSFVESLAGQLPGDAAGQARLPKLRALLERIGRVWPARRT